MGAYKKTKFKRYDPRLRVQAKAADTTRALASSWIRPCRRDNWTVHQRILCPNRMKMLAKVKEFLEKLEERQFGHA